MNLLNISCFKLQASSSSTQWSTPKTKQTWDTNQTTRWLLCRNGENRWPHAKGNKLLILLNGIMCTRRISCHASYNWGKFFYFFGEYSAFQKFFCQIILTWLYSLFSLNSTQSNDNSLHYNSLQYQVRAKLLSKQQAMERSEKAKKQREMKKYGKKVLEVVHRNSWISQLQWPIPFMRYTCRESWYIYCLGLDICFLNTVTMTPCRCIACTVCNLKERMV